MFTVPCLICAILLTVKITFVPSSTTSPTPMLCLKTVPSTLEVSSSYTISTVSFSSVSSFFAASSVFPIT